jgi:hypothetical protein
MKMDTVSIELETRAAQALAALLGRVSAIKFREMKFQTLPRGRSSDTTARRIQARTIIAQIDVYGHRHTLACEVFPDGDPVRLRAALRECQASAAPVHSDATPILIAPYLSPEAQELCKQSKAGFLDFEGNARLTVGEVFIVMRSLPGNSAAPRNSAIDWSAVAHASPALPVPIANVPSALPAISRNRVGSVAIPA